MDSMTDVDDFVAVKCLRFVQDDDEVEEQVLKALELLNVKHSIVRVCSVSCSSSVKESDGECPAYVLRDFLGAAFDALVSRQATLVARPALVQLASSWQTVSKAVLFHSSRPLYSLCMQGLSVCFNGYRSKESKTLLRNFLFIIHSLGGRVVSDASKASHLVTRNCSGDKYRFASTFDVPILEDSWIHEAWKRRDDIDFRADSENFVNSYRVKPFHGAQVYFLAFPEAEREHMSKQLALQGGQECKEINSGPTHVVVDVNNVQCDQLPSEVRSNVHLVKAEWFWASIQMESCADEKLHLFDDDIVAWKTPSTPSLFSPSTPGSHGRRKKRRTEAVRQLAQTDIAHHLHTSKKARSSLGELSGSFLETPSKQTPAVRNNESSPHLPATDSLVTSPNINQLDKKSAKRSPKQPEQSDISCESNAITPRRQVFAELVQTEENYVNILRTIIDVFKTPLEEPKMQLLNQTQMKIIFGNVTPILDVHQRMLKQLVHLLCDANEPFCIGQVISNHGDELMRVYPPFVNFFEDTKKTLDECDRNNPRFHAFLKLCEMKKECGRQTLKELLIRPVQRLASVALLLNDLLKHTKRELDHPDVKPLELAISRIKEVLTSINEDKRKTESQVHIFEIFSDIENCPPHLVSANRSFLSKVDVIEMGGSDELCGKGSELVLYLFSDVLEVSKRRRQNIRSLGLAASRSPSTMSLRSSAIAYPGTMQQPTKPQKHISLLNLTSIRRVVSLVDDNDCISCFTLICRSNEELKERMYVLQVSSEECETTKTDFLRLLCRNIANTMYRPDPDAYLVSMRANDLGLSSNDFNVSKSYKSLNRVKKVFSFNKTPIAVSSGTKKLTRVVSSMISPLTTHQQPNSTTPTGGMENLRLQSCTNLADVSESPRSSKALRNRTMSQVVPPPPSSPSSTKSMMESPTKSLHDVPHHHGFRTPTFSARRASFKFLSNSVGKKK